MIEHARKYGNSFDLLRSTIGGLTGIGVLIALTREAEPAPDVRGRAATCQKIDRLKASIIAIGRTHQLRVMWGGCGPVGIE